MTHNHDKPAAGEPRSGSPVVTNALELTSQGPEPSGSIAVVHATVIDATGASPKADMTILVEGDRIVALGAADEITVPPGAHVVDARGKFVIPGLWDMHVHVFQSEYLPLFLVNGVTGIRHMGAAPVHYQWREQLVDGCLLAPRMVIASRIIDGPYPLRPNSIAVTDETDARQAVRQSKQDGADFLKVYNLVPRPAYFALADEARTLGIPFAGHVPLGVTVAEAAAAGQASVEHLEGVLPASSSRAEEVHRELGALDVRGFEDMWAQRKLIQRAADTHDRDRADELYATFARYRTWQVPTLAVLQAGAYTGSAEFPLTEYLPYIPPNLRRLWEMAQSWQQTAEQRDTAVRLFERQLQVVGDMHRAGVDLMAGTDTFVSGFSLHDELALLVRAGLSRMEALRTATCHPARYLGVTDTFGTIAEGKTADLLLLNANPLDDIGNTRDIHAVLLGGRLLDSAELAKMLATTETRITDQQAE
jgi:Amidohydrolase family